MQLTTVFKRQSFWGNEADHEALNAKIASLNQEGWRVISMTSNTNFLGMVRSYTLLIERD
ncbi:hypothetical protein [Shewanella sp.]|uniref:hypothetical protein n=1 Tax=Shewanella sp. TaxID=50422 RepID=UPI00356590A1